MPDELSFSDKNIDYNALPVPHHYTAAEVSCWFWGGLFFQFFIRMSSLSLLQEISACVTLFFRLLGSFQHHLYTEGSQP